MKKKTSNVFAQVSANIFWLETKHLETSKSIIKIFITKGAQSSNSTYKSAEYVSKAVTSRLSAWKKQKPHKMRSISL